MIKWILAISSMMTTGFCGSTQAPDPDRWGVYSWCSWNTSKISRESHPYIKGAPIVLHWRSLEPKPGEFQFEQQLGRKLQLAKENDFYTHIMIWVAPGPPEWLFQNGVPKVEVPVRITPFRKKAKPVFAHYLNPDYKRYFHRLITEFGKYVLALPADLRERIIFVQCCEGSTGDGQPYKGKPINPKYRISKDQWRKFRLETWGVYTEAFKKDGTLMLPMLVNNDANSGEEQDWMLKNWDVIGCKQGMFSHGYHISDTQKRLKTWNEFVAKAQSMGKTVFTRGEQDGEWNICGWSKQNPEQAFYWSSLFALHCGLDLWNMPSAPAEGDRMKAAIDMFTRYAGRSNPATATRGFCALRRGLDAADTTTYPEAKFGKANKRNEKRYVAIAKAFAKHGAMQGSPKAATGGGMKNRQRDEYNDVGWGILPGNYCRFVTQIDADKTSIGLWHVEPKMHIYSRFARRFDKASGKTAMFFQLNEKFLRKPQPVKVRVVYLDKGNGKWSLSYSDGSGKKTAKIVTCTNSGTWKELTVSLNDARFGRKLDRASDLILEHLGGNDVTFHIIEIEAMK